MPIRGVLLLIFFVGSLPACLLRPFYGIILWYIVAFGNPQAYIYFWPVAANFPWALAVAVPTLIGLFLFTPEVFRPLRSPEVFMMVALWIWFTITSVISTNTPLFMHHAADTWNHWIVVSKMLLMTLVTISLLNSWYRLKTLATTIALIFGFFVLKSLPFLILTHGQFRLLGPPNSMVGDNNDLGLALDMTLPILLFLAQITESSLWRKFYYFLFACTIPAIFFTYSRGALIGLVFVFGLMLMRMKRRLLLIPVICLATVVAAFFAPQAWRERMNPTQKEDSSVKSRLNAWYFSWNLVKDFPVTGGGFSTFTRPLYKRYAPDQDLEVVGPHSSYFEVLAEHGFVGLALYLTLMGSCFVGAARLMRAVRWTGDDHVGLYVDMFRYSLLAFLVSGSFLQRAYFDYTFCIIACLIALRRVAYDGWDEAALTETEPAEDGVTA